jgi:competence protein ComGC
MSRKIRNEKGITLIALIITIIVLLILAGITIQSLTSDDSVVPEAQEVVKDQSDKMDQEQDLWNAYQNEVNKSPKANT